VTKIATNLPGVEIRSLREEHLDSIVELMNLEGWYYYDRHELLRYLALNQECFTLLESGRIAGSIFTTDYGNQAWIGNIVVAKDLRKRGIAAGMIRGVIDHFSINRQVRTYRLGSVPLAIGLYKKIGFHAESFTTAQAADLPLNTASVEIDTGKSIRVEPIRAHDLKAIAEIDKRYFKSERLGLLSHLYEDSIKKCCVCLKDRGKVVGFLMLRKRQASKKEGRFAEGPDYAYRLGPSCILPAYGIDGFKALCQEAFRVVNEEVDQLRGNARIYTVFPKNAVKDEIYRDTQELAESMGMALDPSLHGIFDEHGLIFGARKSEKNDAQWQYMESLGFRQEYFEQVMSYTPGETAVMQGDPKMAEMTQADPEGIFASATPGDKA